VRASALKTSAQFVSRNTFFFKYPKTFQKQGALPTIQAYRRTDLIGNLVRVTNDLSNEFDEDDVVNLLEEWVFENLFFLFF